VPDYIKTPNKIGVFSCQKIGIDILVARKKDSSLTVKRLFFA
jgi:hypothetical protein